MKARHSRKMTVRWLFLFVIFVLIAIFILNSGDHKNSAKTQGDASKYSKAEMHAFWTTELEPIFNQLCQDTYPIPKIGNYFKGLEKIGRPKFSHIDVRLKTMREELVFMAGCEVGENGVAVVNLFIPDLMDYYRELENTNHSDWKEMFRYSFVISLIHEHEHLVYGYVGKRGDPYSSRVNCEKRTWAKTCENVLCVLVEKYGAHLDPIDNQYYSDWIRCGKDVESSCWGASMRRRYPPFSNEQ